MDNKIETIKENIYIFPKNNTFYKSNSFIQACYNLTCIFQILNIELFTHPFNYFDEIGIIQDRYRDAYREALKDNYRFCKENNNFKLEISYEDIELANQQLERCDNFNDIRNYFEKLELNKVDIELEDDNCIVFKTKDTDRGNETEIYSRWVDSNKPNLDENENYIRIQQQIIKFVCNQENLNTLDLKTFKIKKYTNFSYLFNLCRQKLNIDKPEKDYNFGKFTSQEYIDVYSILLSIGLCFENYHIVNRIIPKYNYKQVNNPIAIIDIDNLYYVINKFTNLDIEKIDCILDLLIYDPEFHKDKITITQPIFKHDNIIFYSPTLLLFGMAHDKLIYVLKEKGGYDKIISDIAHDHEKIMTNELLNEINKSNLKTFNNYKVIVDNKIKAEFDIIIYDKISKIILLTELKWYLAADGVKGHYFIDEKINREIEDRLEKENIFLENINKIKDELDINDDFAVKSCIVSKNFSGTRFVDSKMAVFDQWSFIKLLKETNYNIKEVVEKIENKTYLPSMNEMGIEEVQDIKEYAGYTIKLNRLYRK